MTIFNITHISAEISIYQYLPGTQIRLENCSLSLCCNGLHIQKLDSISVCILPKKQFQHRFYNKSHAVAGKPCNAACFCVGLHQMTLRLFFMFTVIYLSTVLYHCNA